MNLFGDAFDFLPPGGILPRPQGTEVLRSKVLTAPGLEATRCLCVVPATSGKVVKCAQCRHKFHAKCHQLVAVRAFFSFFVFVLFFVCVCGDQRDQRDQRNR